MPLDARDRGRFIDMLLYAKEARAIVGNTTETEFCNDRVVALAAIRCVEVIGEAGWYISRAVQAKYNHLPWPIMWAMRNRLIHDYGRTDLRTVYQTVTKDLDGLIASITDILKENGVDIEQL